jgi:hypothetical protein
MLILVMGKVVSAVSAAINLDRIFFHNFFKVINFEFG